jgi:Putative zinc-finger
MTCRFDHDDGPYVLGALSPAERVSFERHLSTCPDCSRSVREMAGLPGLLARVPADLLDLPPADEPVPATLLPRLVREAREGHLRRRWVGAAAAAAVLAAVATGSLALSGVFDDEAGPGPGVSAPAGTGTALRPVGDAQMTAKIAMTSVPWGTRLDLICTYEANQWESTRRYELVVRTRGGRVEQVATWQPLPGRTMSLEAATAIDEQQIRSVEIRAAGGQVLLWLTT